MLPDGELQKTCRLSPSNSKILAADLENKSTGEREITRYWCNHNISSTDSTLIQGSKAQTTNEPSEHQVYHILCLIHILLPITCIFFWPHFFFLQTLLPMETNLYLSLTRYEVACCDGNISLHQCRISPVKKKQKTHLIWMGLIEFFSRYTTSKLHEDFPFPWSRGGNHYFRI